MASNPTVYHVIPNAVTEQWLLVEENGRLRQEFGTKEEALKAARQRGRQKQPSLIKVHTRNGDIESKASYGDDPQAEALRTPLH